MKANIEILCRRLNYHFRNRALLEAALTHRSIRGNNNERLEFLGDSIINFVIADALYQKCPNAKEGELSRLRSNLVRGDTLAELAQEFDLGHYLRLGAGELKSGGFQRKSILADAMEAVIAAIYLDADFTTCQERVLTWYESRIATLLQGMAAKDPKTRLQEYLQAKKLPLPIYLVASISGEAHQQVFRVICQVGELREEGMGHSRRRAEQQAAEKLLASLGDKH